MEYQVVDSIFYLDTETIGLHGMAALIQYAQGNGPIHLHEVWTTKIRETLALIERIMGVGMIGFNLNFDVFHLCKLYTTWRLADPDWIPAQHVDQLAILEEKARWSNVTIKPRHALDLMLVATKGPMQTLMRRKPIRVRRIPVEIADIVAQELDARIDLDNRYFAKKKDPDAPRWSVLQHEDPDGNIDPKFRDIQLTFYPEKSLKAIASMLLGADVVKFKDIMPLHMPVDKGRGYAPFARAWGKPGAWNKSWPEFAHYHMCWWNQHQEAREYARKDVEYTRGVHQHEAFRDAPLDDDDSVLACSVAATRWHGFAIDMDRMREQRAEAEAKLGSTPIAFQEVLNYLLEVCEPDRAAILKVRKTGDTVLEAIGGIWDEDDQCYINYWTNDDGTPHPAAERARKVREARRAKKEIEQYDKMLQTGRFHPSYNVIGTLSFRMSGSDDFNAQGIIGKPHVRQCFLIPESDEILVGGDFWSFELCIQASAWPDPQFEADLRAGKKFYGIFAQCLYPDKTYEEIMASKGSRVKDYYMEGKIGGLGISYFGTHQTLMRNLGIGEDLARAAVERFAQRYPKYMGERQKLVDSFCSMRQDEPGGPVYWADPANEVDNGLGFKRRFHIENQICKALFELAQHPPGSFRKTVMCPKCQGARWAKGALGPVPCTECGGKGTIPLKVQRRAGRIQTASGAAQSALFGCAFNIQAKNMRAAGNHRIQCMGAVITKNLQRRLWDLQPVGVAEWHVRPINVHDEVLAMIKPDLRLVAREVQEKTIADYRENYVPLIRMDWGEFLTSWKCDMETCSVCKIEFPPHMVEERVCVECQT